MHSDLITDKSSFMQRSLSPCSSYDIKMENEYLGIAQSTAEPEPDSMPETQSNSPYRRTTCSIDGIEDPIKSKHNWSYTINSMFYTISIYHNLT